MSSTMPLGGRRPCTGSIHWPDTSARAVWFSRAAIHCVSSGPSGSATWHGLEPFCLRQSSASRDRDTDVQRRSRLRILVSGKATNISIASGTTSATAFRSGQEPPPTGMTRASSIQAISYPMPKSGSGRCNAIAEVRTAFELNRPAMPGITETVWTRQVLSSYGPWKSTIAQFDKIASLAREGTQRS